MVHQPSLGELADELYEAREERLALSKRVDLLKQREQLKRQEILDRLKKEGLQSASGASATVSITSKTQYAVGDWDEALAWIRRRGAWELLHRRINQTAARERIERGADIKGVSVVEFDDVNLTRSKRS